MTFEKSEEYRKALKEYGEKLYNHLLNPEHVLVEDDVVLLFYDVTPLVFDSYLRELLDIYSKQVIGEESGFPKSLGYEAPIKIHYKFIGGTYRAIRLWFDGEYYKTKERKAK